MSALAFGPGEPCVRVGLKGPRAAQWLEAQGIAVPLKPNTWAGGTGSGALGAAGDAPLVVRLGSSEFFLEACGGGESLRALAPSPALPLAGIYPVLREDAAFILSGAGSLDVLAQVCNVDFAACVADEPWVVMTLMIGVSVLIVPHFADGSVGYRIWCDPTFGSYLSETVGKIVIDCGGSHTGAAA